MLLWGFYQQPLELALPGSSKIDSVWRLVAAVWILSTSISRALSTNSFCAPIKLVPLSLLWRTGVPRRLTKLLRQMKASADRSLVSSMCAAWIFKQVNTTPQLFSHRRPMVTVWGQKRSTPEYVNGRTKELTLPSESFPISGAMDLVLATDVCYNCIGLFVDHGEHLWSNTFGELHFWLIRYFGGSFVHESGALWAWTNHVVLAVKLVFDNLMADSTSSIRPLGLPFHLYMAWGFEFGFTGVVVVPFERQLFHRHIRHFVQLCRSILQH